MSQTSAPVPSPTQGSPASSEFTTAPSLAEKLNLRVLLFVAVVLAPVVGLGYVYFESAMSDGVRPLSDGYMWVDLQKMSSFAFDQQAGTEADIPEQWRALDGKQVVLEGEMAPTSSAAREVNQFDLVYSVANCCLSGAPQVQHFVQSTVQDGQTVPYYTQPVRVRGTLDINVTHADGQVSGVYFLNVEEVEPIG